MANKFAGDILVGSVDVSIPVLLRAVADNSELTGQAYTDIGASYWRQGGTRTEITPATLAAVDSAHSDGGFKEVDATNMPGMYRLDLPDAAVASGADWVIITVFVSGTSYVFHYWAQLISDPIRVLEVDTSVVMPQGTPPEDPTIEEVLALLYKMATNKVTQDATTGNIYNRAGDTVDHKHTDSSSGGVVTKGPLATGP